MNIGLLDEEISIYSVEETNNSGSLGHYKSLYVSCYAMIRNESAGKRMAAQRKQSDNTKVFTVRFEDAEYVSTNMMIKYDDLYYEILSVDNLFNRGRDVGYELTAILKT